MPNGTVKFFHERKGYGFFGTDDSEEDIFFHMDDIDGPEPHEGEEFEFEVTQGPKGPRATNIRRA